MNKHGQQFEGDFENEQFKLGTIMRPNGQVERGRFEYNESTNEYRLVPKPAA